MNDTPSGYRIQSALTAWSAARARLLQDDPALEQDEAALVDLLGPEEGDVQDVLARLLRGAVHAESMADAAADRAQVIEKRRERYKSRAQTMRATAFAILDAVGLRKVELEDLTASVRAGTDGVQITDLDAVPDIYVETITTRRADKRTILAALKSGADVPGCERTNGLPSLSIRTK